MPFSLIDLSKKDLAKCKWLYLLFKFVHFIWLLSIVLSCQCIYGFVVVCFLWWWGWGPGLMLASTLPQSCILNQQCFQIKQGQQETWKQGESELLIHYTKIYYYLENTYSLMGFLYFKHFSPICQDFKVYYFTLSSISNILGGEKIQGIIQRIDIETILFGLFSALPFMNFVTLHSLPSFTVPLFSHLQKRSCSTYCKY